MSYFIGWCHANDYCQRYNSYVFSTHWHYWNGVDMTSGVVDAKKFETYEEAETELAGILFLHPERFGQMTIETFGHAVYHGRV